MVWLTTSPQRRYAFIHLSGDYPFVDYTGWGRVVNFFIIIIAVAVVGVPIGLISNGFEDIIDDLDDTEGEGGDNTQNADSSSSSLRAKIHLNTMQITIHDGLSGNIVHSVSVGDDETMAGVRDQVSSALRVVAGETFAEDAAELRAARSPPPTDSNSLQSPSSTLEEMDALSSSKLLGGSSRSDDALSDTKEINDTSRRMLYKVQRAVVDFLETPEHTEEEEDGLPFQVIDRTKLFRISSSCFQTFMLLLILLNVLLVLLETVDSITQVTGELVRCSSFFCRHPFSCVSVCKFFSSSPQISRR